MRFRHQLQLRVGLLRRVSYAGSEYHLLCMYNGSKIPKSIILYSGIDVHFGKSMHVCMICGKHPNEPSVNANSAVFRRTGLETSIDSKTNYASVTQCVLASLPIINFYFHEVEVSLCHNTALGEGHTHSHPPPGE